MVLESLDERICQISTAWESKAPVLYGSMIVPKDSILLEFFNYAILKMTDDGRLSKLQLSKRLECYEDNSSKSSSSLKKVVPLFGILVIGTFFAIICFCIECRQPKWLDKAYLNWPVLYTNKNGCPRWPILGLDSTSSAPGSGSRYCRGCPRRPILGLDSTSSALGNLKMSPPILRYLLLLIVSKR